MQYHIINMHAIIFLLYIFSSVWHHPSDVFFFYIRSNMKRKLVSMIVQHQLSSKIRRPNLTATKWAHYHEFIGSNQKQKRIKNETLRLNYERSTTASDWINKEKITYLYNISCNKHFEWWKLINERKRTSTGTQKFIADVSKLFCFDLVLAQVWIK